MSESIRFVDGAGYERFMGVWSQLVGHRFLDWLAPAPGLRWLDVGCGNGAFTELVAQRCAPAKLCGIDPSEGQLAFARTRPALRATDLRLGDARELPFEADAFDAAVMPLVIFFVPDPARGVSEMARVVRPGGTVAAYGWDLEGGGFPYHALQDELRQLGVETPQPPCPEAGRLDVMRALWLGAGLVDVELREIVVQRTFTDFEDYWNAVRGGPSAGPKLAGMPPETAVRLQRAVQARLPADATGRITSAARAHAVRGRVSRERRG